jgi:hypothetical protein
MESTNRRQAPVKAKIPALRKQGQPRKNKTAIVTPADYNGDTEASAMDSSNKGKGPAGENL